MPAVEKPFQGPIPIVGGKQSRVSAFEDDDEEEIIKKVEAVVQIEKKVEPVVVQAPEEEIKKPSSAR